MRRARHNKTKHNRMPTLVTAILLAVIGAGLLCLFLWERKQGPETVPEDEIPGQLIVNYQGAQYRNRSDLDTFLIMGVDKFTDTVSDPTFYMNNQQADFLLLMIVDKSSKSYCALHINCDTMAEIQRLGLKGEKLNTFTGQLALAHTYGSGGKDSCRNQVQAVSRYLYDVPIDHYFAMTMDGLGVLNDLVGGVTVHIDDDFSAVDPSLTQGKDVTLHGDQALHFVRYRKDVADQSNLSRMVRQREFMNALYKQLSAKLKENDRFARQLATNLSEYTLSDLTTDELSRFADDFKDYEFTGILTIPGEAVKGETFMEFYPDEAALQELVIKLFFKKMG